MGHALAHSGGRSSNGKISVYHRGGGTVRVQRRLDYLRAIYNIPALVLRIEYSPVSNSLIALICFSNGVICYIPAPSGLAVGRILQNSWFPPLEMVGGNSSPLGNFPVGTFVHNLESNPYTGVRFLRAPGAYGRVMSKTLTKVTVSLKSGRLVTLTKNNIAVQGILASKAVACSSHNKAGYARLRG